MERGIIKLKIMRRLGIYLLLITIIGSCQQNKNIIDQILDIDSAEKEYLKPLKGEWNGYFETINGKLDTIYYSKGEKTQDQLFDTPELDSLGIKEIVEVLYTIKKEVSIRFTSSSKDRIIDSVLIRADSLNKKYSFSTNFLSLTLEVPEEKIIYLNTEAPDTSSAKTTITEEGDTLVRLISTSYSTHLPSYNGYVIDGFPISDYFPDNLDFKVDSLSKKTLVLKSVYSDITIWLTKE